jgi:hypothetical protein
MLMTGMICAMQGSNLQSGHFFGSLLSPKPPQKGSHLTPPDLYRIFAPLLQPCAGWLQEHIISSCQSTG